MQIDQMEAEQLLQDLHTVRDWVRWGGSRFQQAELYFGHGTDNAWDEAAQLVMWVLAVPWARLNQVLDARLARPEKLAVLSVLERRVRERLPAPYITGIAWFAGLEFDVTPDVLIPRSPLAETIQQGFHPWLAQSPERILDLCTGSGCIGIACAYAFEDAEVDLSDISELALEVARKNVQRHQLADRVQVLYSDLFAEIPHQYDLIVTNPPYVDARDMAELPPEYLREPALALASGADGLEFTRRLLREAEQHLTPGGVLVVEVGNSWLALEKSYPQVPFTWLEFEQGGHGVFLLTREELVAYREHW